MGYPAAKRQYIIESLSQRCSYQLQQRGRQTLIGKAVQINKGQNGYLAKRMFPGTCFNTSSQLNYQLIQKSLINIPG